jgi:aldose 1-epimerase
VTIRSAEARFLHVFSPREGGFVAVEPVSHANAALNRPEGEWEALGLRVLAPGETMSLTTRVEVAPL